ncbi:LPXTG-motif cell wall anchor domain protein [Actinosynnema mirum DSM 43827]|uniref:LPXTG-motif cell wall anchor domain protein n=1 Tax=Actinosynnema mirum (strain ATCC 29888 / DSM 43827 / JCM 3225 / NBRC 14064 / NCIMB 13271 / NRRL B-12336 / IMRU 3971 / 101) TaxID=446462 RepID=C6WDY1_ACTMD|nr:LPXTG-motif cell wall anchor domain protein [Actinosynnema mirum DSM 43827]
MSRKSFPLVVVVVALAASTPALTASAAPSDCPAGTEGVPITWDEPGLEWPANVVDAQVEDVGGTDLDVAVVLSDPASRNADDSNPLADFAAARPADLPGWAAIPRTGTLSSYGPGYLTAGMNSLAVGDTVSYTVRFTRPVVVPDFTVGGIDHTGLGTVPARDPWHSHQDEVVVTAVRAGTAVATSGTGTGLGGPYALGVDGTLPPGDPRATLVRGTAEPVTALRLDLSNGPDDEAAELADPRATVLPQPANSVADAVTVRVAGFTACLGTGAITSSVYADADRDGVRDPGEAGVAGAALELRDPQGSVLATTTADASGGYAFDRLPPMAWTVRLVSATPPATYTGPTSRTVALTPGEQATAAGDFAFQPPAPQPAATTTTAPPTTTAPTTTPPTTAPPTTTAGPISSSPTTTAPTAPTTTAPAAGPITARPAPPSAQAQALASTGADVRALAPLGALLVALGGLAVGASRRRARRAPGRAPVRPARTAPGGLAVSATRRRTR